MQARTNDRPRFRQDLVAEAIDDQGARYIDVADPDSGSVFRFFEVEYSLACAMDGQRDVAGIVQWAREELGVTPSPAEIRSVIATLDDLGFIDGVDRVIEAPRRETPAARSVEVPARQEAPTHSAAGSRAAARDTDPELAPGVVVGNRQDTVPGTTDMELGEAGATGPHAMPSDMPAAPNFTLGAPGATTPARHAPAEDIVLGMPGPGDIVSRITEPEIEIQREPSRTSMPATASSSSSSKDVSFDLADQMPVRPDDVKEAVRASKVMKAVEMPRDLLDAMEAAENDPTAQTRVSPTPALRPTPMPPPRRTPPPMPAVAPPVERPTPAASVPVATSAAAAAAASAPTPVSTRAPTPLPLRPPAEKQPLQGSGTSSTAASTAASTRSAVDQPIPVAPRRTSPALITLLILIILGAVVYFVWTFVLNTDDTTAKAPTPTSPTPGSGSAAQGSAAAAMPGSGSSMAGSGSAAVPAPAKSKLASEPAQPEDLKAPVAGTVETIEANDKVVKAGDIVARLAGHKPIETEITQLQFEVDKRLPGEVAAAQKELSDAKTANNGAGETAAQKKVDDKSKALDDKKAQLAAKQTELDKFVIKAASAGKLTAVAKAGAKVNADDVVAKIARDPMLAATFEVKGTKLAKDATVKLSNDASPDKTYDCTVVDVAGDNVKVTCPSDPSLEGAAVTLQP